MLTLSHRTMIRPMASHDCKHVALLESQNPNSRWELLGIQSAFRAPHIVKHVAENARGVILGWVLADLHSESLEFRYLAGDSNTRQMLVENVCGILHPQRRKIAVAESYLSDVDECKFWRACGFVGFIADEEAEVETIAFHRHVSGTDALSCQCHRGIIKFGTRQIYCNEMGAE